MGTLKLASLMRETDSYDEPKHKVWYKIAYTHAYSYENALDILMPKLSQHWGLPLEDKYFLVWGKAPKYDDVIDVTPAVLNRLKKNAERTTEKEARKVKQ